MRNFLLTHAADALAIAGAACVLYGLAQLAPWLAWIAGGLLLLVGAALTAAAERRRTPNGGAR